MKKMKKILAFVMAMAMVLGMSVTALAESKTITGKPSSGDTATVTVKNVKKGATVTAYHVVVPTYDDDGFTGYEAAFEKVGDVKTPIVTFVNPLSPTPAEITAIATDSAILGKLTAETLDEAEGTDSSTYSKELGAGYWMVLITDSGDTFYNPMLLGVYYANANGTGNTIEGGELDPTTDTWTLNGQDAFAKSSEPTITKKAEKVEDDATEIIGTQFGDVLKFTVSADIPDYPVSKTDITYSISDTLTGLSLVTGGKYDPSATLGGEEDATLTSKVTTAIVEGADSFTVKDFGDDYLHTNGGKKIVITYYAKVTSTEKINVDKLNNTATLKYSNGITTEEHSKTAETKHYTFGIDTGVSGTIGSTEINKTGEFVKINEKGEIEYQEIADELVKKTEKTEFLSGAEFQLHIGSESGELFTDAEGKSTFTTDSNGRLEINGLDSDVDYYLFETKAPEGYTINSTPVKVKINAVFATNDPEKLISYDVVIGEGTNAAITHYGYDTETSKTTLINTKDTPSNPFGFKNTKLSSLPSTGGIGTTIFTIGGCAIMIVAAGLFFASRRKSSK